MIEAFPNNVLLTTIIQSFCMKKLQNFLEERLNKEEAAIIIKKNVHPYWNMEDYFPRKFIRF